MIRAELNLVGLAVQFFTQIPIRGTTFSPDAQQAATRYFPLVGWLVAGVASLVWWGLGSTTPTLAALGALLQKTKDRDFAMKRVILYQQIERGEVMHTKQPAGAAPLRPDKTPPGPPNEYESRN